MGFDGSGNDWKRPYEAHDPELALPCAAWWCVQSQFRLDVSKWAEWSPSGGRNKTTRLGNEHEQSDMYVMSNSVLEAGERRRRQGRDKEVMSTLFLC